VNDTGNSGSLEGENDALATTDVTFGETQLDAYIVSSDIIKSSVALLEDEEVNLVQVISDILAERIARKENALLTTGTGSSQHNGVVTASAVGKTTTGATAITADEVIDLFHSVDPSYRTGATWMMHDNIALYIRKLKDGDNQYLWSPGLQSGLPDRMLGAPVSINQDMQSSVATATKTVLFGDFKKYKVRRVRQLRFRRLTELYAGNDQEGFVAVIRSDGDLLNAGTNPVKHMLQA
jgi:HK97 family phage major capsid protein